MTAKVNSEMVDAWDGEEGARWAEWAERYEATGPWYTERLLASADIAAGDQVLDIGCGTGGATRQAARAAGPGSALGVDLSGRMLEFARRRSHVTNAHFLQADAQVHPFQSGHFDVAISNFGAMFFEDPVAAFGNIAGGVRCGGRLVVLGWQELARNEWLTAIRGALAAGRELPVPPAGHPGPFGLADPEQVRRVLAGSGWADVEVSPLEGRLRFGSDAEDAWPFVSGGLGVVKGLVEGLDEGARAGALARLRGVLEAHEFGDGVVFDSSAWLISARRV